MCQRRHSTHTSPRDRTTATRRGLLAALGSGTAVAVAGCAEVRSDPRYEPGEIEAPDSENRTAEELLAAEALAEQGVRNSVTPVEALSLVSHEFVLEDGYLGATVQGVVENGSDGRIDTAEIRVRAYDDRGDRLGRYVARTGDLDAGERWAFTVVLLESPAALADYEIAVLGTPN